MPNREFPHASDNHTNEDEMDDEYNLPLGYQIERAMYGIAIILGFIASVHTIRKFRKSYKKNLDVAARLISYKISLSVADALILFVYAPTQLLWITTFWWNGGEILCRLYKFTAAFAFYLTGNMQVLIAFDRLITMTRLNKVRAKGSSDYNTRLFLSLAWILALLASLPQLAIFKIVYQDEDPQCSSVWNEYAVYYYREQERLQEIIHYDGESDEVLMQMTAAQEESARMLQWQKRYNLVHISMMCVLPYVLELILYMLILSFLSDAEKGEFTGFRGFIQRKIDRIFYWKSLAKEPKTPIIILPLDAENPNVSLQLTLTPTRKPSRSCNSSPTEIRKLEAVIENYRDRTADTRRVTISVNNQDGGASSPSSTTIDKKKLQAIRNELRRASLPARPRDVPSAPQAPWMKTVTVVRRNARKKATLMLSFNLIFWLPYCIHGILSSFVELDFVNYQFACALVAFNAITNILL